MLKERKYYINIILEKLFYIEDYKDIKHFPKEQITMALEQLDAIDLVRLSTYLTKINLVISENEIPINEFDQFSFYKEIEELLLIHCLLVFDTSIIIENKVITLKKIKNKTKIIIKNNTENKLIKVMPF